ncbi:MAG: tRNA pseudouridine(38-40) synthase TruA [Spirochaetaceae bacterium]|nr:tRNA pseudouridine(38-40) synthase TruA [Spirochaetaceae bacterium]
MLTLAYDGTDFAGWQVQREQRTVQGVLEAGLARMLDRRVRVRAAGRTDSGVHAIGQVANFTAPVTIPAERWAVAINSYLPPDVRVLAARPAAAQFDARRSALARGYRYQLLVGGVGLPHLRRYCYHVRHRPDLRRLNRSAAYLVGEHDFTVFAAAGDASLSKVRRVISAVFYPSPPYLVFRIVATSFLWKMVRSIVGTLLELAAMDAPAADVRRLIAGRRRAEVGQTAPARGLFLERVWYPPLSES